MDIIEHFLDLAFINKQFSGNSQWSYGGPYDIKQHKNAYGDDMFLSTKLLKLSGAVNGHY